MKTTLKEQIDNKKNLIIKIKTKKRTRVDTIFFKKNKRTAIFYSFFSFDPLIFYFFANNKICFHPPSPRGSLKKNTVGDMSLVVSNSSHHWCSEI
jgi:hypothetical protein